MFVNRNKILASSLENTSASTVTIPFSMNFFPVDNTELVQKEFVEKETLNAINPIVNYEMVKFLPSYNGIINQITNPQIQTIKIILNKSDGSSLKYSDIGITNDDIKFRRNRFLNTFLRFNFYDTSSPTTQILKFSSEYFTFLGSDQRDINTKLPLDVTAMPITFSIINPNIITTQNSVSENYFITWRLKDVINSVKNFYTTVTLNNAVNGNSTQYIAKKLNSPLPINSLEYNENLYIKYILKKDSDKIFKYFIDSTDRAIIVSGTDVQINLYPLTVA